MRIAASADLHFSPQSYAKLKDQFERVRDEADVLVLAGAQLRHSAFQLHGFIDGSPHKILDLPLSKGGQHAPPKTSDKTFATRKSHAIALVAAAIENFNTGGDHHPPQFFFFSTFVIVVPQNHHGR